LAALENMNGVLDARPQAFFEPRDAVKWAVRAGVLKSNAAALISIPPQVARWLLVASLFTLSPC
jgi:hypothetical protein